MNGLSVHVLEAGDPAHPCVLLLHGFPELAYSWRKVMPALAAAGYYALTPDQRGYGLSTGWDGRFDCDLSQYRMTNLVQDSVSLLDALEINKAHLVGHNFGSPVAAYAALTRPDRFRSVVLMSAPFGGAPVGGRSGSIHDDLAAIGRKHYQLESTVAPFVAQYLRRHPSVEIELVEEGGARMPERLVRGDMQLACMPAGDARFAGRLLGPTHLVAVLRPTHRLARRSVIEMRQVFSSGPAIPTSRVIRSLFDSTDPATVVPSGGMRHAACQIFPHERARNTEQPVAWIPRKPGPSAPCLARDR